MLGTGKGSTTRILTATRSPLRHQGFFTGTASAFRQRISLFTIGFSASSESLALWSVGVARVFMSVWPAHCATYLRHVAMRSARVSTESRSLATVSWRREIPIGRNSAMKGYDFRDMTKVEQLEKEVQTLTPEELAAFRNWFAEYDWLAWDRQLEADVAAGKLDKFAAEALAEFERGETTEL